MALFLTSRRCRICGIAGFIGLSLQPKVTKQLMTRLFSNLDVRGTDASGIWGTQDERIVYHKAPIRSSMFVNRDFWKKLDFSNLDMLLTHARAASKGSRHAYDNENNHPFVSNNGKIGMIHNGNIDEVEFLNKKYELKSDTDSEVLLRIFENGCSDPMVENLPEAISCRLNGIREIWSVVSYGAMAVAFGEYINDKEKVLYLFRNSKRPLCIVDLRECLGQILFVSSPEIWNQTLFFDCSPQIKNLRSKYKLFQIPKDEIWMLRITQDNPSLIDIQQVSRFEVKVKGEKPWKYDGVPIKISEYNNEKMDIVRDEEEFEEFEEFEEAFPNMQCSGTEHESICQDIAKLSNNISVAMSNHCMEGNISEGDYEEAVFSLEEIKLNLQGTLRLLEKH